MSVAVTSVNGWVLALPAALLWFNTHATQPAGRDAWDQLRADSEAHSLLKQRCLGDAGEEILGTVENVKGIYLESEPRTMTAFTGGPSLSGVSFTNPPYMFGGLGLSYVEYSSELPGASSFGRTGAQDGLPYVRLNTRTDKTAAVSQRTAHVRVSFKRTTTEVEEKIGVYGRLIEVYDDATNTLVARRRDYVWINPSRRGGPGGYMCPTVQDEERMPTSFFAQVINVKTYTCLARYIQGRRALNPLSRAPFSPPVQRLSDEFHECDVQHFQRGN